MKTVIFTNDNNTSVILPNHKFTADYSKRNDHEVLFRRVNSYLIKNNYVLGNIIDLGAWIGDNSIPWAKQIKGTVYSIDPSPENICYINDVAKLNNVHNVKTIEKAISDKNETVYTTGNINHCSFMTGGNVKAEAVSLDHLLSVDIINDIALIHLDVEGFEYKVLTGAMNIIHTYKPIITFEQHLNSDDYISTSLLLFNKGYNIYMINEVMLGCFADCRNFLALPIDSQIDINDLQKDIKQNALLSIFNHNNTINVNNFTGTIFGTKIKGEYNDIKSIMINDGTHIFAIHDNNQTKMININNNKKWLMSKFVPGKINLLCKRTIGDAWINSKNIISKEQCNIKNILI